MRGTGACGLGTRFERGTRYVNLDGWGDDVMWDDMKGVLGALFSFFLLLLLGNW